MKTIVGLSILAALATAHPLAKSNLNGLLQAPQKDYGHGHDQHHHNDGSSSSSSSQSDVHLALDGGWYSFQFGKEGSWADSEFCFYLHGPAILKLTDYFCAGDRFGVKDNGVWLGPTSYVPFDNCATNTTNPSQAYHSPAFSHAAFNLAPGPHRISIKVLISPYNGGSAAIRLDSVFNKCPTLKHGLAIIDAHVPFCDARRVCHSYDMDLADLDIFNFLDATDVAFQCAGAFSQSWINSWSENDYGHSCLALSTGVAAPGGAINIPDSCDRKLPVLCQARRNPCGRDKPCHHDHDHDHEHRQCKPHGCPPCHQCHGQDWHCWAHCRSEVDWSHLECQPHMPCWPQWCLKHGKCDLAKEALSKKRVEEQKAEAMKKMQLEEQAKKQQLEAAALAKKQRQAEAAKNPQAQGKIVQAAPQPKSPEQPQPQQQPAKPVVEPAKKQ